MANLSRSAMTHWRRTASAALKQALQDQAEAEPWAVGDDPALAEALAQLSRTLSKPSGIAALAQPEPFDRLRTALIYLGPDRRMAVMRALAGQALHDGTDLVTALFTPTASLPALTEDGGTGAQLIRASLVHLSRRELLHQVFSAENVALVKSCLTGLPNSVSTAKTQLA